MKHDLLKAKWKLGQVWEVLVQGCLKWIPVSHHGRGPPNWDETSEYREKVDETVETESEPKPEPRRWS